MTVIDLILELCKYPADMVVKSTYTDTSDQDYGTWGEARYEDVVAPYIENGYVIIE